jgi:hypothetical protein
MLDVYDLVIFARGMNGALLLAEAVDKGLKVALVLESDCNNLETNPFILTHAYHGRPFIPYIKASRNAENLKKFSANLLIQSKLIHCKSTSLLERNLFRFFNLFRKNQIKIQKSDNGNCLEYSSYKYSSDRMAVELLKLAQSKGANIFQYCSLISSQYTSNQTYRINLLDKFSGKDISLFAKAFLVNPLANKDILNKKRKASDKDTSIYFTYPANKIDLKDILIYEKHKIRIFAIPWFGYIYFKVSGIAGINLKNAIELIHKRLSFIRIDESQIGISGIKDSTFFLKEENVNHLILCIKNGQYDYSFPFMDNFFDHSNKIIHKILKYIGKEKKCEPIVKKTVLPSSDFGIAYNPLRIMELSDEKYDLAKQIIKSPLQFKKLFYRYGVGIDAIIDKAYGFYNQNKDIDKTWLMAEIWYCKTYENCKTSESFINTHTNLWMEGSSLNKEIIAKIFSEI